MKIICIQKDLGTISAEVTASIGKGGTLLTARFDDGVVISATHLKLIEKKYNAKSMRDSQNYGDVYCPIKIVSTHGALFEELRNS